MDTIQLQNGYAGDLIECECEPIEKDGDIYKLRVKGSTYLFRWCTVQEWQTAMQSAYENEILVSLSSEYATYEAEMYREEERRQKYNIWLNE